MVHPAWAYKIPCFWKSYHMKTSNLVLSRSNLRRIAWKGCSTWALLVRVACIQRRLKCDFRGHICPKNSISFPFVVSIIIVISYSCHLFAQGTLNWGAQLIGHKWPEIACRVGVTLYFRILSYLVMTSMVDVDLTVYGHTKRRTALKELIHYKWYLLKGANAIQRFQTRYNTC